MVLSVNTSVPFIGTGATCTDGMTPVPIAQKKTGTAPVFFVLRYKQGLSNCAFDISSAIPCFGGEIFTRCHTGCPGHESFAVCFCTVAHSFRAVTASRLL